MNGEQWHKETCPKCGSINWINLGCLDLDLSKVDPEGCICWDCGRMWAWDEEIIRSEYGDGGMAIDQILEEYCILIDGLESPQ